MSATDSGPLSPGILAERRRRELSGPLQEWKADFYPQLADYRRHVLHLLEAAAKDGTFRSADVHRRDLLRIRDLVGARLAKVLATVGVMLQSEIPAPKELLPEERELALQLLGVLSQFRDRTFPDRAGALADPLPEDRP